MKILIKPDRLQNLAYKLQMASGELRSIEHRSSAALASLDWEVRGARSIEEQVRQLRRQSAALSERTDALASYLLRTSEAFIDADQKGADGVDHVNPMAQALLSFILPFALQSGGLQAALALIARTVRLGAVLGETAFLGTTDNLRYLFAGNEKDLHSALLAAKIAYVQAQARGDAKGMEAAHQQANFLRSLGATCTEAEEREIAERYGAGKGAQAPDGSPAAVPSVGHQPSTLAEALSFNVFTPSGLTADQLDELLAKYPGMAGLGKAYAEAERMYGVNALFMIAKDAHETGWGTSNLYTNNNNTGGYWDGQKGEFMHFGSKEESIKFGAKLLAGPMYKGEGRDTIPEVQKKYAPDNADNDPDNLNQHWQKGIGKNLANLGDQANQLVAEQSHQPGEAHDQAQEHEHTPEAGHIGSVPAPQAPEGGAVRDVSPIGDYHVTSEFDETEGRAHAHTGIDLVPATPGGSTVVHPFGAGKVIHAGWSDPNNKYGPSAGYGLHVIVEHPDGTQTLYAHLKEGTVQVRAGQTLTPQDVIGTMGHTGHTMYTDHATGKTVEPTSGEPRYDQANHLHFEVRVNGRPVNPQTFLDQARESLSASEGEKHG